MKSNTLLLTTENFSEMQTELERQLSSLKVKEKDILRTQLLVEELFMRMVNYGHAEQVEVKIVKKFFGSVQIQMDAESIPYNPLIEVTELNEDDDDYFSVMILKANRQRLNWLRKQNRNIVTINVRGESNSQLRLLLTGMFAGIVCGLVVKEFLAPETFSAINETIFNPFQTMFMNALRMVIAPVIFFSVISGVTSVGAGSGVGRIGSKLMCLYLGTTAIASVIGMTVSQFTFSGDVPKIGSVDFNGGDVGTYEFSLVKFIVDIIPANLINPVVSGDMLQIIFLAVLFGMCLNALGDKVSLLQEFVRNCNEFFFKLVGWIVVFVPLIAFVAMVNLVVSMSLDVVAMMGKLIAGQLIGSGGLFCMYMTIILLLGKISPLPFLKKIPTLWAVPFATSSSAVTMPFTMDLCTKRLGISPKISSFSIPIGTTVNMDGGCIYLPVVVIMFLKMYGVEVDFNTLLIIFAMTFSLSVGAPAMPNAAVIAILSITSTFGVPSDEIAGLLFCLGAICDRIVTVFNVTGDVAATTTLARMENMLDKKIYFG